jgi:hypothetical protein
VNKNLDERFSGMENMMKNLLSQIQSDNKKDAGGEIKLGQPGVISKSILSGKNGETDSRCFYCGKRFHYVPDCGQLKEDVKSGMVKLNGEGKLRMADGSFIPNVPIGGPIRARVEKALVAKQNQFYYITDESDLLGEPEISSRYSSQFLNTTESPIQRRTRLEKELEWKEKEDELELRRLKLEREEKKKEDSNKASQLLELLRSAMEENSSKKDF